MDAKQLSKDLKDVSLLFYPLQYEKRDENALLFNAERWQGRKQAGAELGQAQPIFGPD